MSRLLQLLWILGLSWGCWSQKCELGWIDNNLSEFCYKLNQTASSWHDARAACKGIGGDLASITSYQEKAFIMGTVRGMSAERMWLGLNSLTRQNVWKWINSDPMVFFNWKAGSPVVGRGECGTFKLNDSYWDNAPCQTQYGFVCKKRGNVPTVPPTAMTTPQVPPGYRFGCLGEWIEWRGRCYRMIVQTAISWEGARTGCRRMGGDLASVADQDEQNAVITLARDSLPGGQPYYNALWIGLHERKNKGMYEWSDDSKVTYTNWDPYEPNNYQGKAEDCVGIYIQSGGWNDKECGENSNTLGYLCKASRRVIQGSEVPPIQAGCPLSQGWGHAFDRYCYSFMRNPMSWDSARTDCQNKRGVLVDILDRFEQAFIASVLATERGEYWIGLSNRGNNDKAYKWSSGNPVSYTNWYRDFTGNEENKCVSIGTGRPLGLWRPMDCGQSFSYICKRMKEGVSTTILTTTPAPIPCPNDWKERNGYCYIGVLPSDKTKKLTWTEAIDDCRVRGGDLASVHDNAENTHLGRLLPTGWYNDPEFWIGLNHRDEDRGEKWSDGTAVDYHKWRSDQPNRMGNRLNCVSFNMRRDTWGYANCGIPSNWICKVRKGTVIMTPPPPTPDSSSSCGLDTDWRHNGDFCYYVSNNEERSKSWQDARHICMQKGGDLASIHSWEENTFIGAMLARNGIRGKTWIGLNELEELGKYKWSDGSAADVFYWHPGEPNDHGHGQRCVNYYPWNGLWNDDNCGETIPFVCKKVNGTYTPKTTTPTPTVPGYCPAGFYDIGNKCIGLFGITESERRNFSAAVSACRAMGGVSPDLASINSHEESSLLTSFLTPATESYWIGYNSISEQRKWVWVDNHQVVYTNWAPGEPNRPWSDRCAEVWTHADKVGTWNDVGCGTLRGYVCQTFKDASAVINTPASLPPNGQNCKEGYLPYGTACYKRQQVKKSWQAAKEGCRNDGAELASIHNLPENSAMFYFTSMQTQEQVWIGLNDLANKGTYVWTDNWPVSFTNWGNNEPSDGYGKGCVSMNSNGRWNNTLCNQELSSICKTTTLPPPTTPVIPPGRCPGEEWIKYGASCYYLERVMGYESWPNSKFECEQQGGSLVTIHTKEENDWLNENIKAKQRYKRDVWLGMLKRGKDLDFYWDDGSPVAYTNWGPGQPNSRDNAYCVSLNPNNGQWFNEGCKISNGYACKVAIEISTTRAPMIPTTTRGPSTTTMRTQPPPSTTLPGGMSTRQTVKASPPGRPTRGTPRGGLSVGGRVGVAFAVIAIVMAVGLAGLIMYKKRQGQPSDTNRLVDNPNFMAGGNKVEIGGFDNKEYQSSS